MPTRSRSSRPIDGPDHAAMRGRLRTIGPVVAGLGLALTIVGVGDFFMSFGDFSPPKYFWCAFVGLPLLGVGVTLCKVGYLGAMTRYVANETAPVAVDVTNYVANATKGATRTQAQAFGEGLRAGLGGAPIAAAALACGACKAANDADANFCRACGAPMAAAAACRHCGEPGAPGARFCDHCGKPLA